MKEITYLNHFARHQLKYLLSMVIIVITIPLLYNALNSKAFLMGEESYYHLYEAQEVNRNNFAYYPLHILSAILPEESLVIIPMVMALLTIAMAIIVMKRLSLSRTAGLLFLLLFILSPPAINTFINFSAHALFIFLATIGFFVLTSPIERIRWLSIFPFLMATWLDLFSSIILLFVIIAYFSVRLERSSLFPVLLTILVLSMVVNVFVLNQSLLLGPFSVKEHWYEIISDLGAKNGLSVFMMTLFLIGIIYSWRERPKYSGAYIFFLIAALGYSYSSVALYYLSLAIIFFAAIGAVALFSQGWILRTVKKLAFLLFILGVVFSTFTYLQQLQTSGRAITDIETLRWIQENTAHNTIIFSAPEESYYILYFAERTPLFIPHLRNNELQEQNEAILSSTYIDELFPLLGNNKISLLYLTAAMKHNLPSDQGLLFLLKNERFKLIHSHKENEVWLFKSG